MKGSNSKINKSKEEIKPIDHGIIAARHTPVYVMHRYFARRPWNVFSYLIKHYSDINDIILDPFCGGGVTVVEALKLGRKVVGVDINPMATFITKGEVAKFNEKKFTDAFNQIESNVKNSILQLYNTKCTNCEKISPADWYEWSFITLCPDCNKKNIIAKTKKISGGKYECNNCGSFLVMSQLDRIGETIISIKIRCKYCKSIYEKEPDNDDLTLIKKINSDFDNIIEKEGLWYPKEGFPNGDRERDDNLFSKGITHFYKLFTKRNLLALSYLNREINNIKDNEIRKLLELSFTSTIDWSTRLSRVIKGRNAREITLHSYWSSNVPAEINVWNSFIKRSKALRKGKEFSNREIGEKYIPTNNFENLLNSEATCMIVTKSSSDLNFIPDQSINVIITDPPYGGNVQYCELSDLWAVWIKKTIGINELIDNSLEAIQTRHQGFETAKDMEHYQKMLFNIMKECHRVLKPNSWLVMTFHNKEIGVWNSLLQATHDAGFILPEKNGVIYQPPIKAYTTTLHQRASGTMLGDFILSFKRVDKIPEKASIEDKEIEGKIISQVEEVIQYHGGASLSSIYMQLMPFLTNEGLLHKIAQKNLEPYLRKKFEKKDDKWYFKEHIDEDGNVKPFHVIPAEQRIETLIKSILKDKKKATIDEIYQGLYINLTNGMTPDSEKIMSVLNRIAVKSKLGDKERNTWELKTQVSLFDFPEISDKDIISEDDLHNIIIEKIAQLGHSKGYEIHIGQKEQSLKKEFRKMSVPMGNNIQFGITKDGFPIVKQIDVLWIHNNCIISAFEVEKSTSINSGITRFRNLLTELPNLNVECIIVAPDKKRELAKKKINSPDNKRDGINKKVKFLAFSEILGKGKTLVVK